MRIELDERGNFVFVETGPSGWDIVAPAAEMWDDYKGTGPTWGDMRPAWAKAATTRALDRMIARTMERKAEIAVRDREATSKFFALSTLGDMGGMWLIADYAAAARDLARIAGVKCSGIVFDEGLALRDVLRRFDRNTLPTWAGRLGRRSLWKALERSTRTLKATPELVAEEPRSILPLDASRDRHRLGPTSTAAPRQRPPHRRGRGPGPARRRNTRRQ